MHLFKVGGIWWLKVGRMNFSFCISKVRKARRPAPQGPAWGQTRFQRELKANREVAARMWAQGA